LQPSSAASGVSRTPTYQAPAGRMRSTYTHIKGSIFMESRKKELKDRVAAKSKRVEARILELKADASEGARKKAEQLQVELSEVKSYLKDGADKLKSETIDKLNAWLNK